MSDIGDPTGTDPVELQRQVYAAVDLATRLQTGTSFRDVLLEAGADPELFGQPGLDAIRDASIDDLSAIVAAAPDLRPIGKLDLLRDVVRRLPDETEAQRVLAASLIDPEIPGIDGVIDVERETRLLIERVGGNPEGDPLGRSSVDLRRIDDGEAGGGQLRSTELALVAGVQEEIWGFACEHDEVLVNGKVAQQIRSELYSSSTLPSFAPIVDPRRWSDCPVSGMFFQSMVPKGPPTPLAAPDAGEAQPLTETIDFSLGLMLPSMVMTTVLDVTYWDNTAQAAWQHHCIGSTYVLVEPPPSTAEITVDRGFVLAEQQADDIVRVRTLKQVRFESFGTLEMLTCIVWKFATGLLWSSCRR